VTNVLFSIRNAAARTVVPGTGLQVTPTFGLNWSTSPPGMSPLRRSKLPPTVTVTLVMGLRFAYA
jgi:hypothetical protein